MRNSCSASSEHFPLIHRPAFRLCCCALLLLLYSCGGGDNDATTLWPTPNLTDVSAYNPDSPYTGVLKPCATATDGINLCSLETLPLIGQDTLTPAVANVMDRVLVSHSWMGRNFEEILKQLPPDILSLLKGVTAIVIDSDIRPSFYSARTAAIYLDPSNLWLTNEEKATISQSPDYRNDFGDELQFVTLARYVKDNSYANTFYSLNGTETRQLNDILYPVARQLYHELAHANDFLPPIMLPAIDPQTTPFAAVQALETDQVARHLVTTYPLTSKLWRSLAQVLYLGVPATAEQQDYTGDFVGLQFESDGANDPYGYSTIHEDVAMLFEETMLKFHFGIDRDIAFSVEPAKVDPVCDDYLIQWGVRNRLGEVNVKSRAELVVRELLIGSDLDAFFDGIPLPTSMMTNLGWCSNLNLGAVTPLAHEPARIIPPGQIILDKRLPEL